MDPVGTVGGVGMARKVALDLRCDRLDLAAFIGRHLCAAPSRRRVTQRLAQPLCHAVKRAQLIELNSEGIAHAASGAALLQQRRRGRYCPNMLSLCSF